jgi:GntP family gluconate:H+ symporter
MMPLAKAMGMRLGKNYLLLALSVIAGAVMANSYVPPSPGPLFLVSAMNVPIGLMMICGVLLGICTITVGYFIAVWLNKKMPIPLRDAPDARLEDIAAIANKPDKELPSLGGHYCQRHFHWSPFVFIRLLKLLKKLVQD